MEVTSTARGSKNPFSWLVPPRWAKIPSTVPCPRLSKRDHVTHKCPPHCVNWGHRPLGVCGGVPGTSCCCSPRSMTQQRQVVRTTGIWRICSPVPDPPLPSCVAQGLSLILSAPPSSQLRTNGASLQRGPHRAAGKGRMMPDARHRRAAGPPGRAHGAWG